MKRTTILLFALALTACGGAQKMSTYDIIRNAISMGGPTAVLVADAIVGRWATKQTDKTKAAAVQKKYAAIKKTALNALEVIAKGVDIAEEAGKPIDKRQLLAQIKDAVKPVLDFALSLEDAITNSEREYIRVYLAQR